MESLLLALGPVFGLVMLGALLRRLDFPGGGFWPLAERFTYFLLFPALLVLKLSQADLGQADWLSLVAVLLLSLLLVSGLLLLWQRRWPMQGARFTSLYQGGVRFNTYVGLAASIALYGEQGIPTAALFLALMIPAVNVLCILVLGYYAGAQASGLRGSLAALPRNPLILACLLGVLLNGVGWSWPWGSGDLMALLSSMALPLGLLAVGTGLNFRALRAEWRVLLAGSAVKLLLYPLVVGALGSLAGLSAETLGVLVLFACLPTAPSAYVLARQLGGDASLMAALITLQTLLAMLSMPALLWGFEGILRI